MTEAFPNGCCSEPTMWMVAYESKKDKAMLREQIDFNACLEAAAAPDRAQATRGERSAKRPLRGACLAQGEGDAPLGQKRAAAE